jgi:hypothetical protein
MISSRLQSFLAASVDQRQQMANQAMARGGGGGGNPAQILATLTQVANVCNNY